MTKPFHTRLPTEQCISCGKVLSLDLDLGSKDVVPSGEDQMDVTTPIYEGVRLYFETYGNYGSTVLSPSRDYGVAGCLCDECFLQKADRLYTFPCNIDGAHNGVRLSAHEDYRDMKRERFGPAYLVKYLNGERWVDGVRRYGEITSEERSKVEGILMGEGEFEISRELLGALLGALQTAEYNAVKKEIECRELRYENAVIKDELAVRGSRERETQALLHKEASELSISDLQELLEESRWNRKLTEWLSQYPLFHEDGTKLSPEKLWDEIEKGIQGEGLP